MSYPAMSVLSAFRSARASGFELPPIPGVAEEDLSEGRQLTVPWNLVMPWYDEVLANTTPAQQHALCRGYVVLNPMVRTLASLCAGLNAWLDLFWKLSERYTTRVRIRYHCTPTSHELSLTNSTSYPGRGYLYFTHLAAVYAPLALVDEPLTTTSLEHDEWQLVARYAAPADLKSEQRMAETSKLSVALILSTLELLGDGAVGALRDGGLAVPKELRPQIQEAAWLSEAWGLTPTESRVTLSLSEGRRPADVAKELGISVGTVRVHLKHVYAKTETAGQRELSDRVKAWRLR